MGRYDDLDLPPKVKAAFEFLYHARLVTEQVDSAIPMRGLTMLEKSVEAAALRTIQQYLMGEMDFAEEVAAAATKKEGENGSAGEPVNSTK